METGVDIAKALRFDHHEFCLTTEHDPHSRKTPAELVVLWSDWAQKYPIVSIEDRMGEEDRDGWKTLTEALAKKLKLVGDVVFVTNRKIFGEGIRAGLANAILIKLNQIGTVSETLETVAMARKAGDGAVISHRSVETEDGFIADLAVGTGAGQITTGSLRRFERIAKYNRLLAIEKELSRKGCYGGAAFT